MNAGQIYQSGMAEKKRTNYSQTGQDWSETFIERMLRNGHQLQLPVLCEMLFLLQPSQFTWAWDFAGYHIYLVT